MTESTTLTVAGGLTSDILEAWTCDLPRRAHIDIKPTPDGFTLVATWTVGGAA